jgi:nicotinamide-nucleotide amidase
VDIRVREGFGAINDKLEHRIVRLLTEQCKTIGIAESCAGGIIGHLLTNVPGSSRCFIGGVAARIRAAPRWHCSACLRRRCGAYGGVSSETMLAMAEGVRGRLDADIGVGVSGIAGPTGGSPEKPIGTVYLALVSRDASSVAVREEWRGGREAYKDQTAARALRLVEEHLVSSSN